MSRPLHPVLYHVSFARTALLVALSHLPLLSFEDILAFPIYFFL